MSLCKTLFISRSVIKKESFVVAGLVMFSKQNSTGRVSSVHVGFILACVSAYFTSFFNFHSQKYEVIRCAGFQVTGI